MYRSRENPSASHDARSPPSHPPAPLPSDHHPQSRTSAAACVIPCPLRAPPPRTPAENDDGSPSHHPPSSDPAHAPPTRHGRSTRASPQSPESSSRNAPSLRHRASLPLQPHPRPPPRPSTPAR